MTKGHLLGIAAVTALVLSAAAPAFAKGGGHGGHGGGHHGGHGHHVGHAGHAHAAAHVASHVHHNAGFAHHTGRHFAANHAYAHNYAGWNHGAWNHGAWNHYDWRNGGAYGNRGWWGPGWGYGNPGWWGRRYGVWNAGYSGGVAPSYMPYGYGVADPSYYYQYYNNVTVPNVYPSITTLSQTGRSAAIEPGVLSVPPAPADAQPDVCDSSVADSTIPTPAAPAGASATE